MKLKFSGRPGRTALLAAFLSGIVLAASSCSAWAYSGPPESITFANLHLASCALIYIADEQKYFTDNGLAVTIKDFDTGTATIDAVEKGQADMATLAEFLMAGTVMQQQKVSVLGTMDRTNTITLIGLRNRGIARVSDLAGRKIGLGLKTSSEFYLGRFLELNGMSIKDVVEVDTPPAKLEDALSSGAVDAIVGWAPYTLQIQEAFPNETISWPVQSGQSVFGLVVGANDWIAQHPEAITRFWKALAQAEEFVLNHSDEAKAMVQKRLNADPVYMDTVWPQYAFTLSLDQSLITAMEDEARWMMQNNLTAEKTVPDFLQYISEDGLKAVKPEAVNIIR